MLEFKKICQNVKTIFVKTLHEDVKKKWKCHKQI